MDICLLVKSLCIQSIASLLLETAEGYCHMTFNTTYVHADMFLYAIYMLIYVVGTLLEK